MGTLSLPQLVYVSEKKFITFCKQVLTILINLQTSDHFENGSNMIVSIIYRLIQDFHNDHKMLPPVLFLNLDNCARENKVSGCLQLPLPQTQPIIPGIKVLGSFFWNKMHVNLCLKKL